MAIDYSKWDEEYKVTEESVRDIANGDREYEEVPFGDYEVEITKLELSETKAGEPKLVCWFKILEGKFKNSLIFFNQVITKDFQIHLADEFLRSLDTGIDIEWKGSYGKYATLLDQVFDAIEEQGLEYGLSYSSGKKGYPKFEITEVFAD